MSDAHWQTDSRTGRKMRKCETDKAVVVGTTPLWHWHERFKIEPSPSFARTRPPRTHTSHASHTSSSGNMANHATKRGCSLSGRPFVSHRDDRKYGTTVLSVLAGAHSVGGGILRFFDTREARAIRLVCSEFREAVAVAPWADAKTRITRNAGAWRACFPRATTANISVEWSYPRRHNAIVDVDFVHFEGLHTLNMGKCSQPGITDAAFAHLTGIHTLDMRLCSQAGITDAAFAHLKGIHTLNMSWCVQAGITDAAFAHLTGIHTLYMSYCSQAGITDAAFAHLTGIHTLDMSYCSQVGITDAAFAHLKGIHTLDMSGCSQAGITDAAFAHLTGIHTLNMSWCVQAGITDAAFVHLTGIDWLEMTSCSQAGITDAAFAHLTGIHYLGMHKCTQAGITRALRDRLRATVPSLQEWRFPHASLCAPLRTTSEGSGW